VASAPPSMMRALQRASAVGACYVSWVAFAFLGLGLSAACVPGLLLPRRTGREARVRAAIRRLFALWTWWLRVSGVLRFAWRGFEAPLARGTVYIANHPTLVDATLLLARLPDAVCIIKPRLMRNPALGPAARLAGYQNVWQATIATLDRAANLTRLEFPGFALTVDYLPGHLRGDRVWVATRAAAVRPRRADAPAAPNVVPAELVRTVERTQSVRMEFAGPIVAELSIGEFASLREQKTWSLELPAAGLRVIP